MKALSVFLAVFFASLVGFSTAHATLGEPSSTIESNRVALSDADGVGTTSVASRATALAHLRSGVTSFAASSKAVSGQAAQVAPLYEVHETVSAGNTIRQFSDGQGNVFAVTWIGIKKPDLEVLLGRFHDELARLESSQPRVFSRAPRTLRTSQIVVEKAGTMRQKRGRAYLPDQLPASVSLDEIH